MTRLVTTVGAVVAHFHELRWRAKGSDLEKLVLAVQGATRRLVEQWKAEPKRCSLRDRDLSDERGHLDDAMRQFMHSSTRRRSKMLRGGGPRLLPDL